MSLERNAQRIRKIARPKRGRYLTGKADGSAVRVVVDGTTLPNQIWVHDRNTRADIIVANTRVQYQPKIPVIVETDPDTNQRYIVDVDEGEGSVTFGAALPAVATPEVPAETSTAPVALTRLKALRVTVNSGLTVRVSAGNYRWNGNTYRYPGSPSFDLAPVHGTIATNRGAAIVIGFNPETKVLEAVKGADVSEVATGTLNAASMLAVSLSDGFYPLIGFAILKSETDLALIYNTSRTIDLRAFLSFSTLPEPTSDGDILRGTAAGGWTIPTGVSVTDTGGLSVASIESDGATILNNTTAPSAIAGAAQFYADGGEMYVMDASGNATLLSSHVDAQSVPWQVDADSTYFIHERSAATGKENYINIIGALRDIERMTGKRYVYNKGEGMKKRMSLKQSYTLNGKVIQLAQRIELHTAVGLAMVMFAVGVTLNPAFPFQGMLLEMGRGWVDAYIIWFATCGLIVMLRRPRSSGWVVWTMPILFHATVNVFDILRTSMDVLLPVAALYGLLVVLLLKLAGVEAEGKS